MKNLENDDLYIVSEVINLFIRVRAGGYVPKSGFMLIESINKFDFTDKMVVDIGCGETGIVAHYIYTQNARSVVGVDIDEVAINHVKNSSNFSNRIEWILGDFRDIKNGAFDVIVSNPPQMPMSTADRVKLDNCHDSPGETGREMIVEILKTSANILNKGGRIFMLIFDFLGVDRSFNNDLSLKEICADYGFSCEIVGTYPKIIEEYGQTGKNIPWIKNIYPYYFFETNKDGNLFHNILVVEFKR